jgi:hypothetical protein
MRTFSSYSGSTKVLSAAEWLSNIRVIKKMIAINKTIPIIQGIDDDLFSGCGAFISQIWLSIYKRLRLFKKLQSRFNNE